MAASAAPQRRLLGFGAREGVGIITRSEGADRALARHRGQPSGVGSAKSWQRSGSGRTNVYERLVPLTPSRLASDHQGQIFAGLVSDVDAVQNLDLRVFERAAVAAVVSAGCVVLTAALLPSAGAVLAVGFVIAGVIAPLMAAYRCRRAAGDSGGHPTRVMSSLPSYRHC